MVGSMRPRQARPMPYWPVGGGQGWRTASWCPSNFQNCQLNQLKAQIKAYNMLVRNQPLPPYTSEMVRQIDQCAYNLRCKGFLESLLRLASEQPNGIAQDMRAMIQGLVDGQVEPEVFSKSMAKSLNSRPQPSLAPFLKTSLPLLQSSLATREFTIEGINPPTANHDHKARNPPNALPTIQPNILSTPTTDQTNPPNKQLEDFIKKQISKKEAELECPVCLEVAAPPILMCSELHLICSNCRPKVKKCPVCRKSFQGRGAPKRHRFAEQMVQDVQNMRTELGKE